MKHCYAFKIIHATNEKYKIDKTALSFKANALKQQK